MPDISARHPSSGESVFSGASGPGPPLAVTVPDGTLLRLVLRTQPRSAHGARLWAKPQSQGVRMWGRAGIIQRVEALGPAAAGPAGTAALRPRSATVGEAPVAGRANVGS